MAYDTITSERRGDVLAITLNRPERLNACPPQMADELFGALRDIGDARAVLLTGAGRAFCSGADLAANAGDGGSASGGDRAFGSLSQHYNPMILALANLPVPVVAAVRGPAAGVGCSIALAADFVIAGETGYFLQAFVNIGLVPDGGSSWMLPRLIGLPRATAMMMLGERMPATEAERIGLIHRCVPDDRLDGEAGDLAERLAAGPTLALGLMKQAIRGGLDRDFAAALQVEAEAQRRAGNAEDAVEGAMAFLGKRKAAFKGR